MQRSISYLFFGLLLTGFQASHAQDYWIPHMIVQDYSADRLGRGFLQFESTYSRNRIDSIHVEIELVDDEDSVHMRLPEYVYAFNQEGRLEYMKTHGRFIPPKPDLGRPLSIIDTDMWSDEVFIGYDDEGRVAHCISSLFSGAGDTLFFVYIEDEVFWHFDREKTVFEVNGPAPGISYLRLPYIGVELHDGRLANHTTDALEGEFIWSELGQISSSHLYDSSAGETDFNKYFYRETDRIVAVKDSVHGFGIHWDIEFNDKGLISKELSSIRLSKGKQGFEFDPKGEFKLRRSHTYITAD